ncbi:HD domain-containing protein [Deinococcus sedimenti]|uniref:5'-deoxynucleotidase n=1 Tax=Deinococcus sedimenti TaxID=1867090 RepID=A0ABQ2SB30_9DEIO|nr:HD domain-containing protein [Deinococcus sedimenti]GGS06979.1 phosphohydrolase [Deinococcus sedimenti]
MPRLDDQIAFLLTCDHLKRVNRTTRLHDDSRVENSAEHSWHVALMALTLGEYAPAGTNLNRVVELLLVHDLVEIYAGDTFFDVTGDAQAHQAQREQQAADRLFAVLPDDQRGHWQGLWQEFEARQSPEARFARAIDALQPMLLSWGAGGVGCTDRHPDLTRERLLRLKQSSLEAFPALWSYAECLLDAAVDAQILPTEALMVSR